jgi:hypothetical protein
MRNLVQQILDAHGGIERWNRYTTLTANISTGGGLWALKGLVQDSAVRRMTVSLHEQYASVAPFGQPDWHTNFRPDRIAIEKEDGTVIRECEQPRASFAGHTMNTPWDPLHRAYFNGYALWTYLTMPFFMAMPGFTTEEIAPWTEGNEQWRGLRVRFPEGIHSHCQEQDLYFGDDLLLRRHDYQVDIAGSFPATQYVDQFVEVQGLKMPTRRRAYLRDPQGKPVHDMLLVAIDLDGFSFT